MAARSPQAFEIVHPAGPSSRDARLRKRRRVEPIGDALAAQWCAGTIYWVSRHKAEVLAAIDGGLLSLEEACDRYRLSNEEIGSWRRSIDRAGLPGLRITKLQRYRGRNMD